MKLTTYDIFIVICICLLIGIMVKLDIVMSRVQITTPTSVPTQNVIVPTVPTIEETPIDPTIPAVQNDLQTLYPKTNMPELNIPVIENKNLTLSTPEITEPISTPTPTLAPTMRTQYDNLVAKLDTQKQIEYIQATTNEIEIPDQEQQVACTTNDQSPLDILAYNIQKHKTVLAHDSTAAPKYRSVPYGDNIKIDGQTENIGTKKFGIGFAIKSDTFFTVGYNASLFNGNHRWDRSAYVQTIMDLPFNLTLPAQEWGRIDLTLTPRINTVWGSADLAKTSYEHVKVGRAVTESRHSHTWDKIPLWIKESWLKLYSLSEKTNVQIGYFPKKIGLGIVLGDAYRVGEVLQINTEEKFIDQYRPGIQLNTTMNIRGKELETSVYYSLYNNHATSHETMAEFTQAQELLNCGDGPPFKKEKPFRSSFQMNHIFTAQTDIPVELAIRHHHAQINFKPFVMYNQDNNQTVEFFGDATSSLITLGSSITLQKDKFHCCIDFAGNLGHQEVKAWDRNITEEHARMTLTHLFSKSYNDIDDPSLPFDTLVNQSGSWVLSPTFPYPPNQDISLNYEPGEEFKNQDPNQVVFSFLSPPNQAGQPVDLNFVFKNSYSRFRKCYKNKFRALMFAADGGYEISDRYHIGGILGFATGDDNPNDTQEKAYLYRLRKDWNTVRKDKCNNIYQGFQGVQSLYTGNNVRSLHLLRSHKLGQGLSQTPELTANQMTNMLYGGLGVWFNKEYQRGKLSLNGNAIAIGQHHSLLFGLDPVLQDIYETFDFKEDDQTFARFKNYDQRLRQFLGFEINAFVEFFAKNSLTFYGMFSAFFPGSYYKDIACLSSLNQGKNVPFKNQRPAISQDVSGFENAQRMELSLLNHAAFTVHAGIKFDFDTISLHHHRSTAKRRNRLNTNLTHKK